MTTTISDSLVEKIRKLLALASELNDSKEQAELAMQKARTLAVQHDIDLAAIQVFDNKKSEEPMEKSDEISLGGRKSVCQKFICWLLQNHFKVKIIYTTGYDASWNRVQKIVFIGKKSDIEIATYVNQYLNNEFMRLWRNYAKWSNAKVDQRNSFIWGLYSGLSDKLTAAEKTAKEDGFTTLAQTKTVEEVEKVKECMALTVTSHQQRLEEAVDTFFPRARSVRTRTAYAHSQTARSAGYSQGQKISLRRGLGSGGGGQLT